MAPPRKCECMAKGCATCYAREYRREKYRLAAYGQWGPRRIDATAAREHIANLREQGASLAAIVRESKVARSVIQRVVAGKPHISPEVEQRILATAVTESDRIPVRGAQRRIQALAALGWTNEALEPHIGILHGHIRRIAAGRVAYVYRDTDERVRHAFSSLQATVGPSEQARRIATRKGWAPPAAWDDIDTDDKPQGVRAA